MDEIHPRMLRLLDNVNDNVSKTWGKEGVVQFPLRLPGNVHARIRKWKPFSIVELRIQDVECGDCPALRLYSCIAL